jgi:hypothetical protein
MPRTLQIATKSIAISALMTGANAVFAHEGHGLHGSHWHATDLWGYVAVGVLIAAIIWQARK